MNPLQKLDAYFEQQKFTKKRKQGFREYTKTIASATLSYSLSVDDSYHIAATIVYKNKIIFEANKSTDAKHFEKSANEIKDAMFRAYDSRDVKRTISDFYDLLEVPEKATDEKRLSLLQLRIAKLGLGQTCSRCNGSGHYSFNLVHGTVCFKCYGSGFNFITKAGFNNKLYNSLESLVLSGKLEQYFERQKELGKARNASQLLTKFQKAWTDSGIPGAYNWLKQSNGIQPDKDIGDQVNKPIANFNKQLDKKCSEIRTLVNKLSEANVKGQVNMQLDLTKALGELDSMYSLGLELIENMKKKLSEIQAFYSDPKNVNLSAIVDEAIRLDIRAIDNESEIAKIPQLAYVYALTFHEDGLAMYDKGLGWHQAEQYIVQNAEIAKKYAKRVLKDPDPDSWAYRYKHGGVGKSCITRNGQMYLLADYIGERIRFKYEGKIHTGVIVRINGLPIDKLEGQIVTYISVDDDNETWENEEGKFVPVCYSLGPKDFEFFNPPPTVNM